MADRKSFVKAQLTDGKLKEIIHVTDALKANILNLEKNHCTETIPTPEELVGMFFKRRKPSNTP